MPSENMFVKTLLLAKTRLFAIMIYVCIKANADQYVDLFLKSSM